MAAPTYAQAAATIAVRVGAWVALADLRDALATGLRSLGVYPADPSLVADSDLAPLQPSQLGQLLDIAEWRALETALSNCDDVQMRAVGFCGDMDKARSALQKRVDRIAIRIRTEWGFGLPTLTVGIVNLGFAADGHEDVLCGGDSQILP